MSSRNYTSATRAALTAFCSGHCYFPDCNQRLLYNVDGRWVIGLEIAHIYALEQNGPRPRGDWSLSKRNDFQNLIYLCTLHHKVVDAHKGRDYPATILFEWKDRNETPEQQMLRVKEGSSVTAELLESSITAAMEQRDSAILSTLDRLDQNDREAAILIRELNEEIRALRSGGGLVDPDVVQMLSRAASKLEHLPDSAQMIRSAASKLARSVETASQFM